MSKSNKPAILFLDIETSPNIVTSWRIGSKVYLSPSDIIKERSIICICYKWADEDKIHSLSWDKEQDDRIMLERFLKVYEQADMVVGQNIVSFDLRWIRTRLVFHGLQPLPRVKVLDTYRGIKSDFYFNSNKLDYASKYVGGEGKTPVDFQLWKDVALKNSRTALKNMINYCKQDVKALEEFYYKIGPHLPTRFNLSSFHNTPGICPYCASTEVVKKGMSYTSVGVKQRYICRSCGTSFTDGRNLTTESKTLNR